MSDSEVKHPSPTSALSGDLADFNLAHLLDILQIVCKSGILTVKSGNGNAHIQIVNGQPTRAKFGRFDSEQALVAVMRFEKGVCSFEEGALRSDLGSSLPSGVPVQALQLTAAIQKDEARRVESFVPVLQAKLRSQSETWSANQSKLPPFPIGDVYSRIVEHTNGSFRKLLDRAIAPPDMVRAAVGWLIRQGVVASSL